MKVSFVALMGFYGACRGIVGLYWVLRCVGGVGVVGLWGVSIITRAEKGKANPLEKSKKKLTRELKKSILDLRGSGKFL